jgi:hypothetical protein
MLTFLQFLNEGNQKYLYGVNHTDSDAPGEIKKLAILLGYTVRHPDRGGGHFQVHHPETGEHVTAVSMGTGGIKRYRDALKQIHDHQMSIDGFSGFDHTMHTIKKELRQRDVRVDDAQQREAQNTRKPDKGKAWLDRWQKENPELNT